MKPAPVSARANPGPEAGKEVEWSLDSVAAGRSWRQWLLLLPLLYLWFRLINNLRVEWETNAQYSYGYVVPLLCLGLLLQRRQVNAEGRNRKAESRKQKAENGEVATRKPDRPFGFKFPISTFCFLLFGLLAFLYLPTRLIELATPEWRPIQWSLGFIAVGLTLGWAYLARGLYGLKFFAFPICFFLVAIPWPTLVEQPVIQTLTRINAAMVIEVMGILGIPALQHGNVIEVGTGVVGIDEACSGIRSFQSSLMISLFLGALYHLPVWRRSAFVLIGFGMAMVFNLVRTSFLTYVAAKEGVTAIDKYHDPAGLWIMIGCTAGLWLVGLFLRSKKQEGAKAEMLTTETLKRDLGTTDHGPQALSSSFQPQPGAISAFSMSGFQRLAIGLAIWLVLVEVGAQGWYRVREARLTEAPDWSMQLPTENPTFQELPMAKATFDLLRFDDGKQGAWVETNGLRWQAFYFNWQPGRVAGYLAKRHTPEICMPASGREMVSGPELMVLNINGLELPVRRYRFGPDGSSLHVFHCRWEAGATADTFVERESARLNLIRAVWNGRGKQGQKVIEVIISGTEDPEEATALLKERLGEMVKMEGKQQKAESGNAETLKAEMR